MKEIPAAGLTVPLELRFAIPVILRIELLPGSHEVWFTNPSGLKEEIVEAGRN